MAEEDLLPMTSRFCVLLSVVSVENNTDSTGGRRVAHKRNTIVANLTKRPELPFLHVVSTGRKRCSMVLVF